MARNSDRLYVVRSGTSATNTTAVAMAAATAKTVVGVFGTSGTTPSLVRVKLSFDGVTTTAIPCVVEIGITTAAGTVGTAFTPVQLSGQALASPCAAGYNYSAEPTYTRILDSFYVPVLMGGFFEWSPLGDEPVCAVSQGFAVRVTAPAVVNCLASLTYCE
jgi:hypothetical protein